MSALRRLFHAWRGLRAFNTFSDEAERLWRTDLVIKARRGAETTGLADDRGNGHYTILIRAGYDVTDVHTTLLHEMAHIVAGWRRGRIHTRAWRQVFLCAAAEIGGRSKWRLLDGVSRDPFAVHAAARECIARRRVRV